MAQDNLTLLEYLRHANPQIERSQCRKGSNTSQSSSTRSYIRHPDDIRVWDDFGLSTFDTVHDGALKAHLTRQYRLPGHPIPAKLPFCEIHDEDSLDALLISWTQQVVSNALTTIQKDSLEHPFHEAIYMVRGGQAYNPPDSSNEDARSKKDARPNRPNRPDRPDWAGVLRPSHERDLAQSSMKPKTILLGDTKLSSKWSSTRIPPADRIREIKKDVASPISQIYRYCVRAKARYGYLITDSELVAVRIDMESPEAFQQRVKGPRRRQLTLRYKAIPWDNAASRDPELLTVNLALWLLHFLAAWDGELISDEESLHQALHALDRERNASGQVHNLNRNTPTETTLGQGTFTEDHMMSFRSETSDIRKGISGASIGKDGRDTSPAPSGSGRKHAIDVTSDETSPRKCRRSSRRSRKRF
ncbi:MAG: hypothetical protein LQ338_007190 [Usnochroma carphineum]|nr:MAG: hypothetical protein LQ338_007190 [Usnochroma carphineum]